MAKALKRIVRTVDKGVITMNEPPSTAVVEPQWHWRRSSLFLQARRLPAFRGAAFLSFSVSMSIIV